MSEETHPHRARDVSGKGRPGREQEGEGPGGLLWHAARRLGFVMMGLVSGWSLANLSDSESFLAVQALFSPGGFQREGFWEVVGPAASPFDLS